MNEVELRVIRKAIEEKAEEFIKEVECPNCKRITTAIKAGYTSTGEDEYGEDVWRCMLCLKLFKETLVEVKEDSNA